MTMTPERAFTGAAVIGRLTVQLGGTDSDKVLSVSNLRGWTFTPNTPFEVALNRGLAIEEKVLCVLGTMNPDGSGTLTVYTDPANGHVYRGWDDTALNTHPVDSTVEHVWTATDAREALSVYRAINDPANPKPLHAHTTWRDIKAPATTP
jgi:hypothetical protein